jgi:putative nucleotidyltransferase with HDIG domain
MTQIATEKRSADSRTVDGFLEQHPNIQAMPESTVRILQMTRDPNCNTGQLLKLIERDAALSARIMKAVNSSFYSLQKKMDRLDRAVAFMGMKAVKEVTISTSLSSMCKDGPIGNYSTRDLWDHSVGVAILARELAVCSKTLDQEDAFLAGMLHDVGLLLTAQTEVEKSVALFAAAEKSSGAFTFIEQEVFGFDHCHLGARLSQKWKFPDNVGAAIRWHHRPQEAPEEFLTVCRHIFIADTLCAEAKVGFPLTCAHQQISDEILTEAGLSRETTNAVIAKLPILLRLHLS